MRYEGSVYRPPSEARSLLIQATIGCAWNACEFCTMYADKQFRVRPLADVVADLEECAAEGRPYRRLFLCDGDAFVLPADYLAELLGHIRRLFPRLEGVRAYAAARDVLDKTPAQLAQLRALGLDMLYIGLESGSDEVLKIANKGITKAEMIEASALLRAAGIKQSVTILAGVGGEELWEEHIRESADALDAMQPEYLGMLVMTLTENGEALARHYTSDAGLKRPSAELVAKEMRLFLQLTNLQNCFFSSAHVSNYLNLKGRLPQDRQAMLEALDSFPGFAQSNIVN